MKSKHENVVWSTDKQRWRARIRIIGERVHLGYFRTEEEAARAVHKALKK